MSKADKICAEITVRVSVAFYESPGVHTLLRMTPVRERGRLLRSVLERFIAETNHPAGDVNAQIAFVSECLRAKTPEDNSNFISHNSHQRAKSAPFPDRHHEDLGAISHSHEVAQCTINGQTDTPQIDGKEKEMESEDSDD